MSPLLFSGLPAHAPHDPKPNDPTAALAFWHKAEQALQLFPPQVPLIILAAASAHLGGVQSTAVAGEAPDGENGAGHAFHDTLLRLDLSAANTFGNCHVGQSATYSEAGLRLCAHQLTACHGHADAPAARVAPIEG